jgi:hypothetical protein
VVKNHILAHLYSAPILATMVVQAIGGALPVAIGWRPFKEIYPAPRAKAQGKSLYRIADDNFKTTGIAGNDKPPFCF